MMAPPTRSEWMALGLLGLLLVGACTSSAEDIAPFKPEGTREDDDEETDGEGSNAALREDDAPSPSPRDAGGPLGDAGVVEVTIDKVKDCSELACPAATPHLVGCVLDLGGDDARGCVARTNDPSRIFVKEGNDCGEGSIKGKLVCSTQARSVTLDSTTCPMNKREARYAASSEECQR